MCPACRRWNLSPLEERWEAIEACERAYRDTRHRYSTGEIGIARLPDGTELVRVGRPLRLEFAAWRYGDGYARRRRAHLVRSLARQAAKQIGESLPMLALLNPLAIPVLVVGSVVGGVVDSAAERYAAARARQVVARVPLADGRVVDVTRGQLEGVELAAGDTDGGWALDVPSAAAAKEAADAAARAEAHAATMAKGFLRYREPTSSDWRSRWRYTRRASGARSRASSPTWSRRGARPSRWRRSPTTSCCRQRCGNGCAASGRRLARLVRHTGGSK